MEYKDVILEASDFEEFAQAVKAQNQTGNYTHVLENTSLFGYMPYSQALVRLWAAFHAAIHGHEKEAKEIVQCALYRLPIRNDAQYPSVKTRSVSRSSGYSPALLNLLKSIQ